MERVEELKEKLKKDAGGWEEKIFRFACDLARTLAEEVLEELDNKLMEERDDGMKVVASKEHWLTTIFGDIRIKRRLYREKDGNYRFLLDEKMGLDKGSHVSPKMKELAILASTRYTFREVEQNIKAIFPWGISHTTIHNLSSKVAGSYIEVKALFEDGVIPETAGKVVPYLIIEADGVNVALQREEKRKAEIKVGIVHEGWQEISKERYKLKEKSVYSGIMNGDRFWEGFSLSLSKKYDLSKIGNVIVGGDGAPWVKEGAELLGGHYELDRFHLKRALHQGLANDPLVAEVYQACVIGEIDKIERLLTQAQEKADSPDARKDLGKEIMKLRGYLMGNCYGLRDYQLVMDDDGLRGLGAIEGNVDKLIADRMKKRGMSWTKRGADRMARLMSKRYRQT